MALPFGTRRLRRWLAQRARRLPSFYCYPLLSILCNFTLLFSTYPLPFRILLVSFTNNPISRLASLYTTPAYHTGILSLLVMKTMNVSFELQLHAHLLSV